MVSQAAGQSKPLTGLRCLVCGMDDSRPIEQLVKTLGGKLFVVSTQNQTTPDAVVSDRATAQRLQAVLSRNQDVPVVRSAWVEDCRRTGSRLPYAAYTLAPLTDCLISFTNVSKRDRPRLCKAVEELGGRVTPDMTKTCTHLVVGHFSASPKLKAAEGWHIPVLPMAWLQNTIQTKRILPVGSFPMPGIRPVEGRSAARSATASAAPSGTTSAAQRSALAGDSTVFSGPASSRGTESGAQLANAPDPFEAAASRGALADTGAKAPPAAAVLAANASEQHASEDTVMRDAEATAAADTPLSAAADRTELSEDMDCAPMAPARPLVQTQASIFEHKHLHLTGMAPAQFDECAKIVSRHRGTRGTKLLPFVTHVVVGSAAYDAERLRILQFADEHGQLCHIVTNDWLRACDEEGALVDEKRFAVDLEEWRAQFGDEVPVSQARNVFAGHFFFLALDDDQERRLAKEIIRSLGGQEILDSTRSLVSDWSAVHSVCPASFPPERVAALRQRSKCFASTLEGNCGNFFWLTVCQMSLTLVPTTSCVFQPVSFATPLKAFAGVVVVISGYGDGVRRGILHAVQLLGGECIESVTAAQWSFVTHLMSDSPSSKKWAMGRSKGIPCVGTSWLTACLTSGTLADPAPHAVRPPAGLEDVTLPSKAENVEATQAAQRPQFISQGGLKARPRQGSRSRKPRAAAIARADSSGQDGKWTDATRLGNGDSSILRQLSQNLSLAAPSSQGAATVAPCDLGAELRSMIPTAVCASAANAAAPKPLQAAAKPPVAPQPSVPQGVLRSFAAAHGVEPESILGSQKRRSNAEEAPAAKRRPSAAAAADEGSSGSRSGSDAVLAGMAAARRDGAPVKSALSLLAEQLEPGMGSAGVLESQGATQLLSLTQGRLAPLAPQPLPVSDSSGSRGKARRRVRPPAAVKGADGGEKQENVWADLKHPAITSTQVAFSQQVDFLACKPARK